MRGAAVNPTPLSRIIQDTIRKSGPLPLSEFMALCLGHPEYGYYMTRPPFGAEGDFITAPEISQLFGEMLALWVMIIWEYMGKPEPLQLVEIGPGRGTLMKDIWRVIGVMPALRKEIDIHLVEFSPRLQDIQRQTLTGLPVTWHKDISTLPDKPSLVIANEFFDALPIEQAVYYQGKWHERVVVLSPDLPTKEGHSSLSIMTGDRLTSTKEAEIGQIVRDFDSISPPENAIFEYSPQSASFMTELCGFLQKNSGAFLAIDYGDSIKSRERFGETLQAVHRHKTCGLFEYIGNSDLTAHVAFAPLIQIATEHGCECAPVLTQREFLTQMGIRFRAEKLIANAYMEQTKTLQSGLRRLIDPTQMGDLFKVLQVYKK